MKNIISLGSVLLIVCVIAGASLSLVYKNTKPIIDKNSELLKDAYKKKVIDNAVTFKTLDNINMFEAYDVDNNKIGFVVIHSVKGYSGNIEVIVGLDLNNKVTGMQVLKQTETPGLGAKIKELEFTSQFKGLVHSNLFFKNEKDGMIDAITGATISSKAVMQAVSDVIKNVTKYKKEQFALSLSDGVFKGNGKGEDQRIVQTKVYIENGKIVRIEIVGRYRKDKLYRESLELTKKKILKTQTININTREFSGSVALINSVKDAVRKSKETKENAKF